MRAVGMAGKDGSRQTKSLQNKALQANTASGCSIRHRPQETNSQQVAGLAAKTAAADDVVLPLAVQVSGGSAVVLAAMKAGSDLPNCSYPTYRLCLSLSLPTPLICKKNPI